jgi:hypothetical protein
MTVYVGIDPGIHGALALLDDSGAVIETWKMPLDRARKFCPIETWKLLREIDNIAADRFDSVSCSIEGLLSLPSDTAKITLLIKMVEKNPMPELFENLYQELKKTDGRVGSVTMGKNFGILIGQIAALGWKYVITPPRSWQSIVHQGITGPTAKIRSYNFVKTIFPEIDVSKRGGGFDDGITDALCIAYYCRKKLSV